MRTVFHKINEFLSAFAGWLMLLMMALLLLDVISRGIDKPLQGVAEMSVFVMMVVIYFGLARCEEHDENVRIELLLHWLPWKYRKFLLLFVNITQTGVVGIFLFEMVRNTLIAYRTREAVAGTVQLPIWPIKILIVIGLFFYLMSILVNTYDSVKNLKSREEPFKKPQESPPNPPEIAF